MYIEAVSVNHNTSAYMELMLSAAMIQHFFCVSYDWETQATKDYKAGLRDQRLAALCAADHPESALSSGELWMNYSALG